jgi:hypothetical protein
MMEFLIEPPNMHLPDIHAFFTTKFPGDRSDKKAIARMLGIENSSIYLSIQEHTDRVHILEGDFAPVIADAVITVRKSLLIGVLVADCVPVLLYDKEKGVIGAVHAGWRGTAKQILKKTIMKMQKTFGSLSKDILIAIGPSIRQCSYEVDRDVMVEIRKATGRGDYCISKGGKYFIDLSSANKVQAISVGVPEENIWQSDECTFCNPDRFYSYRYSGNTAGRQGGFIGMW